MIFLKEGKTVLEEYGKGFIEKSKKVFRMTKRILENSFYVQKQLR